MPINLTAGKNYNPSDPMISDTVEFENYENNLISKGMDPKDAFDNTYDKFIKAHPNFDIEGLKK